MKLWSDFYDLAIPDLPGCPYVAIDFALRQAAISFCEQSLAWRYVHPDIAVVNTTSIYPYVPPAEAVVHTVIYAEFNDVEIETAAGQDNINLDNWRHQTGVPQYVLGGPDSATLVPTPDVDGTLKMTVVLKPSPLAIGIDDAMFNEYRHGIVHGALAKLMLSPSKPYTKSDLAAYHQQQFVIAAGGAGMRVARNYTRAPLQTSILSRGRRWG